MTTIHPDEHAGRVERAHLTLQDRLVKELRLEGISSIEAANAFMPRFIDDYNTRLRRSLVTPTTRTEQSEPTKIWTPSSPGASCVRSPRRSRCTMNGSSICWRTRRLTDALSAST
jgi:hypothetical protein